MKYKLKVYYWNPNGTNDVEVIETKTLKVVEALPEALFGLNVSGESETINPRVALRFIACSPVENGSATTALIQKYIKLNEEDV